jgi:uracil permease
VTNAAWIAIPEFGKPEFNMAAILFMIPVAIAPIVEHVGGILAIGSVTARTSPSRPACIARCWAMVWRSISSACSAARR